MQKHRLKSTCMYKYTLSYTTSCQTGEGTFSAADLHVVKGEEEWVADASFSFGGGEEERFKNLFWPSAKSISDDLHQPTANYSH